MKARYIRTSTLQQNEARQLAKQHPNEQIFIDKISGTVPFAERPEAQKLLDAIKKGDVNYLSVSSIDRMGRNTLDVLQSIDVLTKAGVVLKVDNLGLESIVDGKENPTFLLICSVLANISSMERATLRERQLEGIIEAKKRGVYKGRELGTAETPEQILSKYKEVVKFLRMKKPLRDVASRCDVALGTVQKVKKALEQSITIGRQLT
jgi:DNA invertase Pin-like site-specific DNA recombinase